MRLNSRSSSAGIFVFTLAVLAPLVLTGCGRKDDAPAAPTGDVKPAAAASDFKMALVESGSRNDQGWNALAADAFAAAQKTLNLPEDAAKSVDNQNAADKQEKSLRDFAAKKFNVIFAHGAEFENTALKLEKDFPNTLFVVSSGRQTGHNTTPIILKLEDGAYLEGMAAAAMSKTGKIGSVGAEEIVPLKSLFTAFEQGAKAINPNIQVMKPVYTGKWDDANLAKASTLVLLNQGADVIMQDVDAAAQGVFSAVQEFNKSGKTAYALGTNKDQNSAAPDVVLASAPIYLDKAFADIAAQQKAGTFKPNTQIFDMKTGYIGFILNPQLESKLPAGVKQKLDEAKKKIMDGTFVVPQSAS